MSENKGEGMHGKKWGRETKSRRVSARESERMNLYLLGDKYARNFSFCAHCAYGTNDIHGEKRKAVWRILLVLFSLVASSVRSLVRWLFFICLLHRFCTNKVLVIFELFSLWLPEIFITQHWVSLCFLLDTLLKFWFTRFFLVSTLVSVVFFALPFSRFFVCFANCLHMLSVLILDVYWYFKLFTYEWIVEKLRKQKWSKISVRLKSISCIVFHSVRLTWFHFD